MPLYAAEAKETVIPAGALHWCTVTKPVTVICTVNGLGWVATCPNDRVQAIRDTRRAALLAVQEYLEMAFVDLTLAPACRLTMEDRTFLDELRRHFNSQISGFPPLAETDVDRFAQFPR